MKKEIGIWIGAVVIVFVVLTAIGFATGEAQVLYNKTVGKQVSSSETEMWKESKGYVDGMAQDLSKYQLEYVREKDPAAKEAIANHIRQQFANYDINNLKDVSLQQFLRDIRNGN